MPCAYSLASTLEVHRHERELHEAEEMLGRIRPGAELSPASPLMRSPAQ